jgi:hypothetical protein
VAFEVSGPVEGIGHCHCSMCRKFHGAPFVSYASAPKSAFRWLRGADRIRRYEVTPGGFRPFCSRCGSPLPNAPESLERVFIPVGLLADDPKLGPMSHMFVGSKAPWYTISDSQPQYEEFPPGWGEGVPSPRKTEPTPEAVRGSCLCGSVTWEIPRPIGGAIVFCHCTRCRRSRAAAHNANFFVELDRFRWMRGADKVESFKLPEAARFSQSFCRECGSAVPFKGLTRVVVPAATLDDDPGIGPGLHIFVTAKAPWFEISDDLPRYDEYPPTDLVINAPR